jgi:hypothetical protein
VLLRGSGARLKGFSLAESARLMRVKHRLSLFASARTGVIS